MSSEWRLTNECLSHLFCRMYDTGHGLYATSPTKECDESVDCDGRCSSLSPSLLRQARLEEGVLLFTRTLSLTRSLFLSVCFSASSMRQVSSSYTRSIILRQYNAIVAVIDIFGFRILLFLKF
jgi:hypothetical protein